MIVVGFKEGEVMSPRELKSEIFLPLRIKGTHAHQLVCCLMETGCSLGLRCEYKSTSNKVENKKGSFITTGSAEASYHIPAFSTNAK
jgi:hypothetical protein